VNGNGRPDFADVVLYFNQLSWIAANEPVTAFDNPRTAGSTYLTSSGSSKTSNLFFQPIETPLALRQLPIQR
jgi:hypothetical protein